MIILPLLLLLLLLIIRECHVRLFITVLRTLLMMFGFMPRSTKVSMMFIVWLVTAASRGDSPYSKGFILDYNYLEFNLCATFFWYQRPLSKMSHFPDFVNETTKAPCLNSFGLYDNKQDSKVECGYCIVDKRVPQVAMPLLRELAMYVNWQ